MNRSIYPGRSRYNQKETSKLNSSDISDTNKKLIRRFLNNLVAKGSSDYRKAKLSSQLRRICQMLNCSLSSAYQAEVEELIAQINSTMLTSRDSEPTEATRADYRRCIKQFYLWYEGEDERLYSSDVNTLRKVRKLYRFVTKDVKTTYKDPYRDPTLVLTDEDILKVLNASTSTRDKAFISFLYHTGVRIEELLNIRIGQVVIKDTYAEIEVTGKTGQRAVWLGRALPYLVQYLDVHPCKHDNDAYLWMGESPRYGLQPLQYVGAVRLIHRAFKAASSNRKHNPHWFRHSRATHWALEYPESVLCKLMGWRPGSKQVRRYVHLSRGKIRQHFLSSLGLVTEDKTERSKPRVCVCGTSNDVHMRYCYKCGKPLHVGIVMEDSNKLDEQMMPTIQKLMEIMQNPELLKKFEQFKLSRTQESPADPS